MKTIIAVWGTAAIGKSSMIKTIFEKLNVIGSFEEFISDGDIKAIGNYNGKLIGIESQGDPYSRQGKSLGEFANRNCDIIICASRTKGETVNNIIRISESFNYEVIWTSSFSGGNRGIMSNEVDLNNEFSTAIINLIDKLK